MTRLNRNRGLAIADPSNIDYVFRRDHKRFVGAVNAVLRPLKPVRQKLKERDDETVCVGDPCDCWCV